jgi:glycosyltransferase involved in cell wall biosynthesis
MKRDGLRVVVVPSDPIAAYEAAGYDWLERYYNPEGMFREVFALSPLEKGERHAYGMTIRGVSEQGFQQALHELQPDVVRGYGGYWAADLVCAQRLRHVPIIVSVHDTRPELLFGSVPYADRVICMSQAVADLVIQKGTSPEKVRILPNRIDTAIFHPVTDKVHLDAIRGQFPPGKYLLHVGRKTEQKNLETVLHALALLPEEYKCVFVGLGDPTPYVQIAERLGIAGRCYWKDSIRNAELAAWYSWCDCMCTPSLWEGFGIVFIEAAACGAAIVTSEIAPMNEYLTPDKSASLVKDFRNSQAVADAVRRVCEDAPYRERLHHGAIEAALPFDRRHVDAAEAAIYREAIALPPLTGAEYRRWQLWRARRMLGQTAKRLVPAPLKPAARRLFHRG